MKALKGLNMYNSVIINAPDAPDLELHCAWNSSFEKS